MLRFSVGEWDSNWDFRDAIREFVEENATCFGIRIRIGLRSERAMRLHDTT